MLFSNLHSWRPSKPSRKSRRGAKNRRKAQHKQRGRFARVEQLEDRLLLAANITEALPDLDNGLIFEEASQITVSFSEDVVGADQASNYELINAGIDGLFDTPDDTAVVLGSAYANSEATLQFPALQEGRYRLTISDAITDTAGGDALDGDGDSLAGGDWVREFHTARVGRAGPEFQVNTFTNGQQHTSPTQIQPQSVAMDAAGNFVVTWTSQNQDGSDDGVYGQRYDAAGTALGGEFQINTYVNSQQRHSTVAMDAAGNFVVTWSSYNQDGSAYGVYGQRYDAAGTALGGEFQINTYVSSNQTYAKIAMDAVGNFVVTWSSLRQDGDFWGVYGQRYDAAGTALGGEFQINTYVSNGQQWSTVAMDAAGNFVVTWSSYNQDGSAYGVYGQRYDAAGTALGGEFQINTHVSNEQQFSTVAMDAAGNFVVTWSSKDQDGSDYGVYGQRYDAAGTALGGEFQINTYVSGRQKYSTVAMDAAGNFVVTWTSQYQDGSGSSLRGRRYDAAGTASGGEFQINTYVSSNQQYSTVAMDAEGKFVVTWSSYNQDGSSWGVYGQRFSLYDTLSPSVENANVPASGVAVYFSEEMSQLGGGSGAHSVLNPANWTLLNNGTGLYENIQSIAVTINNGVILSFNTPLSNGDYVLTANETLHDVSGNALDGDGDGLPGGDFSQSLQVDRLIGEGLEFQVNTFINGNQTISRTRQPSQSVAMDAAGNFVVTWTSPDQDGSGDGVYGQRYDAAGTALGSEFQINTYVSSDQLNSRVAMDAVGNFVVAWSSENQDGSGFGVYGQRYDASGNTLGGEFQINTNVSSDQRDSTVAMDAVGNFVVTWSSNNQDGSGWGIFGQRYDAAGNALGSEFQINTHVNSWQLYSTVAMDAAGNFVVTWSDGAQDGDNWGVYGQRYDAAGNALGSEFQINTYVVSAQIKSTVAMDAVGNFVIVWSSAGQDGSLSGIYGQRYDAAGNALGGEFQINTLVYSHQIYSTVAMDAAGNFVVTWTDTRQDGSGHGVYGQRYDADGNALGGEFRINTHIFSNQLNSSVAMDAAGNFVVVWDTYYQDGFGTGVYGRLFSPNLSLTAAAGGSYNVVEGGTVQLDGSASTDPEQDPTTLIYEWDFDGDGTFGEIGAAAANGDEAGVNPIFSAAGLDGPSIANISLRVTDDAGQSDIATTTVTVDNVAPTIAVSGSPSVDEGSLYTLTLGAVSDPGADTIQQYEVNWGDASSDTFTAAEILANPDVTHVYSDDLSAAISVDLIDEDGTHVAAGTKSVTVKNVSPVIAVTGAAIQEITDITGTFVRYTAAGSFVDPGLVDTWTVTVDYKDGTVVDLSNDLVTDPLDPSIKTFQLSHDYYSAPTQGKAYRIGVTVSDDDGGTDTRPSDKLIVVGTIGGDDFNIQVGSVIVEINGQTIGTFEDVDGVFLWGGAGDDVITVDSAITIPTVLLGGEGNDTITGGSGDNTIDGGDGNDTLTGGGGTNTLIGGEGDDNLVDGGGTNTVIGGGGSNTFIPGSGDNEFESTPGSTTPEVFTDAYLVTEDGPSVVAATLGVLANDVDPNNLPLSATLVAAPAHGILVLDADGSFTYEPDVDFLGADSFTYTASNGSETSAVASVAINVVKAVADGDVTIDADGIVRVGGTSGNDSIIVSQSSDGTNLEVTVNGVSTTIPLADVAEVRGWGRAGNDQIHINGLAIETLMFGGDGDDTIQVSGGLLARNTFYGGTGNDRLRGGQGNDVLFGGDGDDLLVGKSGRDLLIGGLGADRIIGNADDDILIAGLAHFKAADTDAVMEHWTTDDDAAVRQLAINDYIAANSLIIEDDGERDILTGSAGTDWFFANFDGDGVHDKVTDLDDELLASDLDFILAL